MPGLTSAQRDAIQARGDVLVVAGAGTGKTHTLVERCVEWLLEAPKLPSLDQVLMVTFTEAAAAEMRQRIRSRLQQRCGLDLHSAYLREQLALIDTALISTLHSFCLKLVRQHFYELDLDPQLAVAPEEETQLLAEQVLTAILEKHYAEETTESVSVQRLIQTLARGWDVPIKQLVLRLHHYAQTLPDPAAWLAMQRQLFSGHEPAPWRQWLPEGFRAWASEWISTLERAAGENANAGECFAALKSLPADPNSAQIHSALERILAADKLPWPHGSKKTVRGQLKEFFHDAEFLWTVTGASPLNELLHGGSGQKASDEDPLLGAQRTADPLEQDWIWVRPQMLALLDLTLEFQRRFGQEKRELGLVDFHDLEQFTLRLLWDNASQRPTRLAEQWRARLRMIFVDEYQDINAAQDAILRALGNTGLQANRFLVGDPKQSIYRFRLADPHIFQAYIETWSAGGSDATVLPLVDNFRSRQSILDVVNAFFSRIMRKEVGGVGFDELAHLRFGDAESRAELTKNYAQGQPQLLAPVELHLRLTSPVAPAAGLADNGEEGDPIWGEFTNAEEEARLIGLRLAELRSTKRLLWDGKARRHRPLEWRDVVILLRSPQFKAEAYAKQFCRLGIPLAATRSGFFEGPEISDLLSLLSVLDNPLQDVPLLAVLRSPLVSLSFDELALVRLAHKGKYWTALQTFYRCVENGHPDAGGSTTNLEGDAEGKLSEALADPALRRTALEVWPRIDLFLRRFRRWRRLAQEGGLCDCLEAILSETQYLALLAGQPRGQQQRANVNKLLNWARRFDESQRQGLYRFLKFIEAQREAQIDQEPAPLDTADAVRLMSIHQSKGLEFPVVVLADLGKPFNFADLKGEVILDAEYGLCPLVKTPLSEQRYASLPYWLAQRRQRRETVGEEMRLLYVAMTRACQCLVLAGTTSRSAVERWSKQPPVATLRQLLSARTCLDWLGPWLSEATRRSDWATLGEGSSELLDWRIHEEAYPTGNLVEETSAPALAIPQLRLSPAASEDLIRRVNWRYPFEVCVQQAAKVSVSTLRQGILMEIEEVDQPRSRRISRPLAVRSSRRLTAAAVGTAHHRFLQFASMDCLLDPLALAAEAERMERCGILSSAERAALDLEAIAGFWNSKIGREILARREQVHRELAFAARLSLAQAQAFQEEEAASISEDLPAAPPLKRQHPQPQEHPTTTVPLPSSDEEFIVVTGVVDLAVLFPKEIWILDFKTDAVRPEEWKRKAKLYQPQIRLYALALSQIYGRPVTRAWLHSLALRRTLQCLH